MAGLDWWVQTNHGQREQTPNVEMEKGFHATASGMYRLEPATSGCACQEEMQRNPVWSSLRGSKETCARTSVACGQSHPLLLEQVQYIQRYFLQGCIKPEGRDEKCAQNVSFSRVGCIQPPYPPRLVVQYIAPYCSTSNSLATTTPPPPLRPSPITSETHQPCPKTPKN